MFAPWVAPHNPFDLATLNLLDALSPPHGMAGARPGYLLGTDDQGRDVLSAIMFGARISLLVGLASVIFAMVLGVSLGLIAGYVGGKVDAFIMRIADVQLSFPAILIALLIDGVARAVLPRETHGGPIALFVLIFAIGISNWVQYARTVRGSTLVEKNKEYIQAARVIGIRPLGIMRHHLLPNVLGPVLVLATINIATAIITEATLSFLGVGVPPTQPSLGTLIRIGNDFLFSGEWWITIFPGAALVIMVLAINLLGDWLRDALNPRLQIDGAALGRAPAGRVSDAPRPAGRGRRRVVFDRAGRGPRRRRRIRRGQIADRRGDHRTDRPAGPHRRRAGAARWQAHRQSAGRGDASRARPRDRRGLPGSADLAQPAVHDRPATDRDDHHAPRHVAGDRPRQRALDLLAEVGISAPKRRIDHYPHQFSGGMRQRVVIALALAAKPKLIIADEPTTALDVSIQAQIIALLKRLCRDHGTAVMLITHDMGVIAETADRVAVMYAGRIVEIGPVADVIHQPQHPYTRGLMGSIPSIVDEREQLAQIDGAMPRLTAIPAGCPFHPRCAYAFDRCRVERPELLSAGDQPGGMLAACDRRRASHEHAAAAS